MVGSWNVGSLMVGRVGDMVMVWQGGVGDMVMVWNGGVGAADAVDVSGRGEDALWSSGGQGTHELG